MKRYRIICTDKPKKCCSHKYWKSGLFTWICYSRSRKGQNLPVPIARISVHSKFLRRYRLSLLFSRYRFNKIILQERARLRPDPLCIAQNSALSLSKTNHWHLSWQDYLVNTLIQWCITHKVIPLVYLRMSKSLGKALIFICSVSNGAKY